jgi:hypothetical protein
VVQGAPLVLPVAVALGDRGCALFASLAPRNRECFSSRGKRMNFYARMTGLEPDSMDRRFVSC